MLSKQDLRNILSEQIKSLGGFIEDLVLPPFRLSINRMHYPRTTYYFRNRKLSEAGLIKKVDHKKYGSVLMLTEKGKQLLNKPKKATKRTDGLSTIILFDIPEEKRRERNIFRRYLLRNGYTLIQKSFLIAPFKISGELKELIRELRIEHFIKLISGRIDYF
jgi:hypothetical protein